jgi:hypothetical protein
VAGIFFWAGQIDISNTRCLIIAISSFGKGVEMHDIMHRDRKKTLRTTMMFAFFIMGV